MSTVIKIFLTINLEGSTLVRKSEEEKLHFIIRKKDLYPEMSVEREKLPKEEAEKIIKQGYASHHSLEAKPARLHINLSLEAYEHMRGTLSCPFGIKMDKWAIKTPEQRLEYHLDRLCMHHNGTSYSYEILDN